MRKGEKLSASQRAEKARANTRRAMTRDLLHGRIFARLWPSYLVPDRNEEYGHLLCVDTPIGERLVWRVTAEELPLYAGVPRRKRTNELPLDRIPVLQMLADHGW